MRLWRYELLSEFTWNTWQKNKDNLKYEDKDLFWKVFNWNDLLSTTHRPCGRGYIRECGVEGGLKMERGELQCTATEIFADGATCLDDLPHIPLLMYSPPPVDPPATTTCATIHNSLCTLSPGAFSLFLKSDNKSDNKNRYSMVFKGYPPLFWSGCRDF